MCIVSLNWRLKKAFSYILLIEIYPLSLLLLFLNLVGGYGWYMGFLREASTTCYRHSYQLLIIFYITFCMTVVHIFLSRKSWFNLTFVPLGQIMRPKQTGKEPNQKMLCNQCNKQRARNRSCVDCISTTEMPFITHLSHNEFSGFCPRFITYGVALLTVWGKANKEMT